MRRSSLYPLQLTTLLLLPLAWGGAAPLHAQFVVPGSGTHLTQVGDDLEDESWEYVYNQPKSSKEQDEQVRPPGGRSKNGRWLEGGKRGQPDVVKRVPTPAGGLPGSTGALLLRSSQTGIPGRPNHKAEQDDFLLNVSGIMRGPLSPSQSPNFVVRVYLPPFEEWEDRSGTSFAVRAGLRAYTNKEVEQKNLFGRRSRFSGSRTERVLEPYWPGIFIQFRSETDRQNEKDSAYLVLRAGPRGHDFKGPEIEQLGWWTFGMSITPNGQVHYFAHPGVENLTAADHLASRFPYGFNATAVNTFFFNVVAKDDHRTWSTPWVIDDPAVYVLRSR